MKSSKACLVAVLYVCFGGVTALGAIDVRNHDAFRNHVRTLLSSLSFKGGRNLVASIFTSLQTLEKGLRVHESDPVRQRDSLSVSWKGVVLAQERDPEVAAYNSTSDMPGREKTLFTSPYQLPSCCDRFFMQQMAAVLAGLDGAAARREQLVQWLSTADDLGSEGKEMVAAHCVLYLLADESDVPEMVAVAEACGFFDGGEVLPKVQMVIDNLFSELSFMSHQEGRCELRSVVSALAGGDKRTNFIKACCELSVLASEEPFLTLLRAFSHALSAKKQMWYFMPEVVQIVALASLLPKLYERLCALTGRRLTPVPVQATVSAPVPVTAGASAAPAMSAVPAPAASVVVPVDLSMHEGYVKKAIPALEEALKALDSGQQHSARFDFDGTNLVTCVNDQQLRMIIDDEELVVDALLAIVVHPEIHKACSRFADEEPTGVEGEVATVLAGLSGLSEKQVRAQMFLFAGFTAHPRIQSVLVRCLSAGGVRAQSGVEALSSLVYDQLREMAKEKGIGVDF